MIIYYLKVDSARYGIIGAFVSNRIIKVGEELLINYGAIYANILGKSDNPKMIWYHELWKKFKEQHPDEINYIEYFEKLNKERLPFRSPKIAFNYCMS